MQPNICVGIPSWPLKLLYCCECISVLHAMHAVQRGKRRAMGYWKCDVSGFLEHSEGLSDVRMTAAAAEKAASLSSFLANSYLLGGTG